MRWAAITIGVYGTDASVEAAASVLIESGCSGVAHKIGRSDEVESVTGFLPEDERLALACRKIDTALYLLPNLEITGVATEATVELVDEEDWANSWKQYFKPIRIGRHLIVTPPWEDIELGQKDKVVVIDPGMAFGTGTHPTTQLCLAALEDYIEPGKTSVLADIGTGSGILAIAAAKLGVDSVIATDIDPLAIGIAQENAKVNDVKIEFSTEFDWTQKYDIVVANILASVLIEMAEHIADIVVPGGIYIASGIYEGRENDVRLFTEAEGFQPLETRHQGEWVALVFRRLDGEGN